MPTIMDTAGSGDRITAEYTAATHLAKYAWIAFTIGNTLTYESLKRLQSCQAFSKRDQTQEVKAKGWSGISIFDMVFRCDEKRHKIVKFNLLDENQEKLMQLIFIPDVKTGKQCYPMVLVRKERDTQKWKSKSHIDCWEASCAHYKRLMYFFSILEMHYNAKVRPLRLKPNDLEEMILDEYMEGHDSIALQTLDVANNLDVVLEFPDNAIEGSRPNVQKLATDAIKQTISLSSVAPKIVGFRVGNMKFDADIEQELTYVERSAHDSDPTIQRMGKFISMLAACQTY